MGDLDRKTLEYPREFRIRYEDKISDKFQGICYGMSNDPDDEDNIKWTGGFIFSTGHYISFKMTISSNFPEEPPIVKFDEYYNDFDTDSCEDEMKYYIESVKNNVFTTDKLEIKNNIYPWGKNLFIGEWLLGIRKTMFRDSL